MYDSYFQTKIAADFAYSDQNTALDNPISLRNVSNLFTIKHLQWICTILHSSFERNIKISDTKIYSTGYISMIAPGGILNISCNKSTSGPGIKVDNANIIEAAIELSVEYDAEIFWLSFHRHPDPFPFRWVGKISQPQWIKGRDIE